uniref:Putative serum amyloid a n=1 Tax=Amblyomma triste TaxID=251400 RepID=A0A023G8Q6_AMBTT
MQLRAIRPSLVLLPIGALVLVCSSMTDGYSAPVQWGVFAACMRWRAGPLLATRSGACASKRMLWHYRRMQSVNCRNCDKYFHCQANYQAVRCKGRIARRVATAISDCRERSQPGNRRDMLADQAANRHGRSGRSCNKYLRPYKCYYRPSSGKCKK